MTKLTMCKFIFVCLFIVGITVVSIISFAQPSNPVPPYGSCADCE
jgi:hypothetical protein